MEKINKLKKIRKKKNGLKNLLYNFNFMRINLKK